MIPVRKYKALWDYVGGQIPVIERVIVVDDEPELASKIKDIADKCVFLVAVIPSSDLSAFDEDNHGDIDTCVIYLLQKVDRRDEDDDDIMDERELTQNAMKAIRTLMLDLEERCDNSDPVKIMQQMIRGKQHVDRERNYLGCNGYSLSFGIKTNGF